MPYKQIANNNLQKDDKIRNYEFLFSYAGTMFYNINYIKMSKKKFPRIYVKIKDNNTSEMIDITEKSEIKLDEDNVLELS